MTKTETEQSSNFLPDFCNVRVLFVVLFCAEILAIVLSLNTIMNAAPFLYNLAMNSLFIQWIALSCVGLLCLFRHQLNQLTIIKAVSASYLIILLVTLVITELAWWNVYRNPDNPQLLSTMHLLFVFRSLAITAIIGGLVLRYLYIQHEWRHNIEMVAESRLQALQSRIRPHFLFNCMNSIASLTRTAPAKAETAVEDLAELFRASLLEPTRLYPITEEWKLCELYLRIEGLRLGDRLLVDWQIDGVPDNALIPPLCLQPLLENSIYHGIERMADGGTIRIRGEQDEDLIRIVIENPLPDDNSPDLHQGNRLAQENIRQRLLNMFEDNCELRIDNELQQYKVTVTLPYQTHEHPDR